MTTHWILGPGAIGRLIAHSLTAVCDVAIIGRRELPAQQTLSTPEGKQKVQRLETFALDKMAVRAPSPPAFVHITTKAMAAEAALASLAERLPDKTPLVLWQNGFLAQPRITRAWAGPVLCATTTQGAYLTGDDGVVHAGHGPTFLGNLHQQHGTLADSLAQTLTRAGLATTPVNDIRQRLWQKLAVNAAINPLVALNRVRNGELHEAAYTNHVEAVVKEVAAILHAEGIQSPDGGHNEAAWLTLVWQVVGNTANNKASMLQDVEAKRFTERSAILGPLMESAQRHGLAYETLARLNAELAALEATF